MTKKMKAEQESKEIIVSNFESSLKHVDQIKSGDEEKWKEDFEQRKEEWVKKLRLDVLLEEAMFIINDMYSMKNGQKLLVVK